MNGLDYTFFIEQGPSSGQMLLLKPKALLMLAWSVDWCTQREISPHFTSIIRPYDDGSKSDTHQTGRAVDLSLKAEHGWTADLIDEFMFDFSDTFKEVGALVYNDDGELISRPIKIHGNRENSGQHAHLQCRR